MDNAMNVLMRDPTLLVMLLAPEDANTTNRWSNMIHNSSERLRVDPMGSPQDYVRLIAAYTRLRDYDEASAVAERGLSSHVTDNDEPTRAFFTQAAELIRGQAAATSDHTDDGTKKNGHGTGGGGGGGGGGFPWGAILLGVGGAGLLVASVAAIPILMGFGTAGIVGGSAAAAIQSSIGNVVAGSAFATFQSLGATGALVTAASTGGAVAAAGGAGGLIALQLGRGNGNAGGQMGPVGMLLPRADDEDSRLFGDGMGQSARKSLESMPNDAEAIILLVMSHVYLGEYEQALDEIHQRLPGLSDEPLREQLLGMEQAIRNMSNGSEHP